MSQRSFDHRNSILTFGNSPFILPDVSRTIQLPLLCVLSAQFFRLQAKGFVGAFPFFAMQRKINRNKSSGVAITYDQSFKPKAIPVVNMVKYLGYSFNKFASFKTARIINNQTSGFIRRFSGSIVNQVKKAIHEQKHHHAPIYPGIILQALISVLGSVRRIATNIHPYTLIGNGHDQ